LAEGLAAMAPGLREIAANGHDFGLEPDVLDFLATAILAQAAALESLR
jgi:hypothetical protein